MTLYHKFFQISTCFDDLPKLLESKYYSSNSIFYNCKYHSKVRRITIRRAISNYKIIKRKDG